MRCEARDGPDWTEDMVLVVHESTIVSYFRDAEWCGGVGNPQWRFCDLDLAVGRAVNCLQNFVTICVPLGHEIEALS